MPNALPAFPTIDNVNWSPPIQSTPEDIGRSSGPFYIYANADNADYQDNVLDVTRDSGTPRLNNWWDGAAPQSHELVVRQFWKMVPNTFTHIYPGTSFQESWGYQHGISSTDSQSITAQMGFSGEGISASLSATLSHSVTINDQESNTTQYTVQPPATGTRVWLLGDLMYEFMLVQPGTYNFIPKGTYRGDVDFSGDDHYSGAYLDYRWTHLIVSAGILCPQDRVFP
jgi:hypothetical protein